MTAQPLHVLQVDEAKIFIHELLDKTPYEFFLHLEGQEEGSTEWINLYTFDAETHEGWNTIFAPDGAPFSYHSLRFHGEKAGSCRITEAKLIGLEVIAGTSSTHDCAPVLTLGGVETALSPVTFDEALTPYLDAVTPRYGNNAGGEQIVFTGVGFSGTPTVTIDDLPCVVDSSDATSITCTTAPKPASLNSENHPLLVITI